jgi:hypothetical protein
MEHTSSPHRAAIVRAPSVCRLCFACFQSSEPTVHSVFSPTFGSTWFIGGTYNVSWFSTNLTSVEILLLTTDASQNILIALTISPSAPNSGSFSWTIPASVSPSSNAYFVTVRPVGAGADSLDGFSRSPAFSILVQPTGACPAGSFSSNGNYSGGCNLCPQGQFSVGYRLILSLMLRRRPLLGSARLARRD